MSGLRQVLLLLCVWILSCGLLVSAKLKKSRIHASRSLGLEWTEPSACSRTCGGGVAYRERLCSRFSGADCEPEKKYFLCNTQECPQGSDDFRDVQCRQFDSQPFDGVFYKWIPYYGAENQCALNCLAKGEQFYRRLADRVVDGTPCDRNTLNVCIEGSCQHVGCDRVLGSNRALDACLICGGYGATCTTMHGTISTEEMGSGYNRLILLPEGATSITIQEEGTSKNYFAVRKINGDYYLNGDFKIGTAEPQLLGQTFFEYRRPHYGAEYLSALGPLKEPLIVELLKQPGISSPSVKYDYSVPSNMSSDQVYTWIAQAWKECNASCGLGYLNRVVTCINVRTKGSADNSLCENVPKPSSVQKCHRADCTADWYVGEFQPCSETCGNSGTQVRKVFCQRTLQGGQKEVVSADQCPQPKPEAVQDCNVGVPCAEWEVGQWSECTTTCGAGEQTRAVACRERQTDLSLLPYYMSEENCDVANRPLDRRTCNHGPCLSAEWMVSEWSGCSGGCGDSVETRQLKCSSADGRLHPFSDCDSKRKPETSRACLPDVSCVQRHGQPQWFASQWSECSVSCGSGTQHRTVFCGLSSAGQVTRLPLNGCDAETKLPEEQECAGSECSGVWFTGPFGKCSAMCGGGQRHRELFCFVGEQSVDLDRCSETTRPDSAEDCNQNPCDDDNLLPSLASDCRWSEFGCCPDHFTAADGPNYLGCASDPIPAGLCIDSDFGCCPDGITPADGPFQHGCDLPTCHRTKYGCCADGETPAVGPEGEGCSQDENDLPYGCQQSVFGCCPDGVTARRGLNGEGCREQSQNVELESSGSGSDPQCELSIFGCCPDGKTLANGPDHLGCHVYHEEKVEKVGVVDLEVPEDRLYVTVTSRLPDPLTVVVEPVRSTDRPVLRHRDVGLHLTTTTRLPDILTDAAESHDVATPFSVKVITDSPVRGAEQVHHERRHGCHASNYGCCPDGRTPASGPNHQGCPRREAQSCEDSAYGCCPDGVTPASGPNDAYCPHLLQKAAICTLPKDPGPCNGHSIKWFFDSEYGNCVSFDYGGCGGNANQFDSRDACRKACIDPEGIERCYLPQSNGRCYRSLIRYSFNPQSRQCEEFVYGGCLGNENRFSTMRDCEKFCVEPQKPDVCNQPPQSGNCYAHMPRFYFDRKTESCRQFVYGGCGGNENRFDTWDDCEERCGESVVQNCRLPLDPGPCRAQFYQWYFNSYSSHCEEFKYGGCLGNANRFRTKMDCEKGCKRLLRKTTVDRCSLLPETGPCRARHPRWYFDQTDGYCKEFVYGGCDGNENRFDSEPSCRQACDANLPIDVCTLPAEVGNCRASIERYYFDDETKQCQRFHYGGCEGNGNNFKSPEECHTKCSHHIMSVVPPEFNRCLLPRDPGPCIESMIRWHYSPLDRRCVKFGYGGCAGNHNRFMTESSCSRECGYLALITTSAPTQPPPVVHTEAIHVRHPHASSASHEDPATEPAAPAPTQSFSVHHEESNEVLPENAVSYLPEELEPWFPDDVLTTQPDDSLFTQPEDIDHWGADDVDPWQPPEHVTERSEDDVGSDVYPTPPGDEATDSHDSDVAEHPESWMAGGGSTAAPEEAIRSGESEVEIIEETHRHEQKEEAPIDYETAEFEDRSRVIESSGEVGDFVPELELEPITVAPVAVTTATSDSSSLEICSYHANPGLCRNSTLWRWHYDQEKGECVRFRFGGCEGNENNFESQEECDRACPVKDICHLPSKTGRCPAAKAKTRFFFDVASGKCKTFVYGGCDGNANRFLELDNCKRVCESVMVATKPDEEDIDEGEDDSDADVESTPSTTTLKHLPLDKDDEEEDICRLPSEGGMCRAYFLMFYFDSASSSCQIFIYGGCGGNANRFGTIDECENRCLPARPSSTPAVLSTSTESPTTSPAHPVFVPSHGVRHWDVCKMHKDSGPCEDYQVYWYFEPIGRHCRRFYYGGCGGNDNKYNSSEECHARCLNFLSPPSDSAHSHVTREFTRAELHTTTLPSTTESVNVVHLTDSYRLTTSMAPPLDEPPTFEEDESSSYVSTCDQPLDTGRYCTEWQEYWYFDSQHSRCRSFYYGGCDGNENRFATEAECTGACQAAVVVETSTDPCRLDPVQGPCKAYVARWFYSAEDNACKDFVYGGCGGNENSFETKQVCEMSCRTDADFVFETDVCLEPKETGPCTLSEQRWYFDLSSGRCLTFTYGGCQGNTNNFATEEDCASACSGHLKTVETEEESEVCSLPKDAGPCFADDLRFYWSPDDRECRPFTYGGCQGNGNNFETQEECYNSCGRNKATQRRVHGPGDCFLPHSTGPCRAALPRWYYDSAEGDCQAFHYGGCEGNANNFLDYDDCVAFCSRVPEACGVLQCDLTCPFGLEHGPDSCPLCQCHDPCKNVICPENSHCRVENSTTMEAKPVCRPAVAKVGTCPPSTEADSNVVGCTVECEVDNDCQGVAKCCHRGCNRLCLQPGQPEEVPVIEPFPSDVAALVGSSVVFRCTARGAPRPMITWYRDYLPISDHDQKQQRVKVLPDGNLQISKVEADDAEATFSCRAYNNVGSDTRSYKLTVNVPVEIERQNEAEVIETLAGSTIEMTCIATGNPPPSVQWLKDGEPVSLNRTTVKVSETGIQLTDVESSDAGAYVCRAENAIGSFREKTFRVEVVGLTTVEILAPKTNVTEGDNIKLHCRVSDDAKGVNVTWQFNGKPLKSEVRYKVTTSGELVIDLAKMSDTGEYTCTATRGREQSSASVLVNVHALKVPDKCVDKPWYANCDLIVEAGLCRHAYFSIFCCSTCHRAGHLP